MPMKATPGRSASAAVSTSPRSAWKWNRNPGAAVHRALSRVGLFIEAALALGLNWNRFPASRWWPSPGTWRAAAGGRQAGGTLDGAVSWSGWENLQGQIAFHAAALTLPNSPAVEFDEAKLLFDGDRIHLAQALVRTADSEASLEADYRLTTQELRLDIASESMTIAAIRTHAARLPRRCSKRSTPAPGRASSAINAVLTSPRAGAGRSTSRKPRSRCPAWPTRCASAARLRLDGAKLWSTI